MAWSVIIPALNEAALLPRCLLAVARELPDAEILVVDGGSSDATRDIAATFGATILQARGRGAQCCAGATEATGDWLLFLHADTLLPAGAARCLSDHAERAPQRVATFRLRFDRPHWFLRLSGWCTRFDTIFTRFGDQGIAVSRQVWQALGGMPPWPLFEDVAFLEAARQRAGGIVSLPAVVTTSARRYGARPIRRQWDNLRLILRFRRGACPFELAREYEGRRQLERSAAKVAQAQG